MTTPDHESVSHLMAQAQRYLQTLCSQIPTRTTGSQGNRIAAEFVAERLRTFGFGVETPIFDCLDWRQQGATLKVGEVLFHAAPCPYALGCTVEGPLLTVSTVHELECLALEETSRSVLLVRGEIAREQLMPKNFPFYNPDEHKHIVGLLESKRPLAIITATGRDPQMVGSMYPFPLIEDGDFEVPVVYVTDVDGDQMVGMIPTHVHLESRAERIPAQGWNVVARKGSDDVPRIVCFAHLDTKPGTPGASDNASGVVTLLLLAELLSDYEGTPSIEIVAMNGEDYFSSPGEQQYLAQNAGRFGNIRLGINIDGVGYHKGGTGYSLYECPPTLAETIQTTFVDYPGLMPGESWYQGDHALYLMNRVPALAITSERLTEVMGTITHTAQDTPDKLEVGKLAELACALHDLILRLATRGMLGR